MILQDATPTPPYSRKVFRSGKTVVNLVPVHRAALHLPRLKLSHQKNKCHPPNEDGIPFLHTTCFNFTWVPRHVKISLKSGRFSGLQIDLLTLLPNFRQWIYGLSSPLTATGSRLIYTAFPFTPKWLIKQPGHQISYYFR